MGLVRVLGLMPQLVADADAVWPGHGVALAMAFDRVATAGFLVGVALSVFVAAVCWILFGGRGDEAN